MGAGVGGGGGACENESFRALGDFCDISAAPGDGGRGDPVAASDPAGSDSLDADADAETRLACGDNR